MKHRSSENRSGFIGLLVCAGMIAGAVQAYPLDGGDASGIRRLEGYLNAQSRPQGPRLPAGALLDTDDVRLRLTQFPDLEFDAGAADETLQRGLERMLRARDPSYGVVLIDISDPEHLRWASVRPDVRQIPGSVGKLLCMVALFDGLARAFPDPLERERVLKETLVRGGDWVLGDTHEVPRFDPGSGRNRFAVIRPDESFYLSEWIDHMVSASANGAGSVVWREAILLRHFGQQYPVTFEQSEAFFRETSGAVLSGLAQAVIAEPLQAAGLSTDALRQGSFWTRASKRKVSGSGSWASPRELARLMFRLEQGRLVDTWSSREMKRYLYTTKRRYRYIYAPELDDAAVFFKSGSLYQCQPEENFTCKKYHGNLRNLMNSLAIVEYPARGEAQRRYIVALMSNVLKQNSAWDHSRIAAAIQKLIESGQASIQDRGSAQDVAAAGQG